MSSGLPARNILKIVFDTNIYISAFLKSGFSRELLNLAFEDKIELFCSQAILLELKQKLKGKFQVEAKEIKLFITLISQIAKIIPPAQKLKIIKIDPQDNIILEAALVAGANLIVSLDKHLIKIKKFHQIGLVNPKTLRWIVPDLFEK